MDVSAAPVVRVAFGWRAREVEWQSTARVAFPDDDVSSEILENEPAALAYAEPAHAFALPPGRFLRVDHAAGRMYSATTTPHLDALTPAAAVSLADSVARLLGGAGWASVPGEGLGGTAAVAAAVRYASDGQGGFGVSHMGTYRVPRPAAPWAGLPPNGPPRVREWDGAEATITLRPVRSAVAGSARLILQVQLGLAPDAFRDDGDGIAMEGPPFGAAAAADPDDSQRVVGWLRRASGDAWLRPWRLTPKRLAAYAAAARSIAYGGPAVEAEAPAGLFDADRQPLLRPWAFGDGPGGPDAFDPARAVAELLAARPALAAAVRPHMSLDDSAAAQLKLLVSVRALVLLFGVGARDLTEDDVRAWVAAAGPRAGAEADFAASLVTLVAARAHVDSAFVAA